MRRLGPLVFVMGCAQVIGLSELDFDPDTCDLGQQRSCYEGPPETKNQGLCVAGTQTCSEIGWGPCVGEVVPAPEYCLTPEDESCNGDSGCTGNVIWPLSFGGPSTDDGVAVAADESGVVIAGTTRGGIDFGGGARASPGDVDNLFLAAFSGSSAYRWDVILCKSGQALPHDLALTSDGRAVVTGVATQCGVEGATLDGVFVASFDAQGTRIGARSLAPVGELYVAIDVSDRIVVAGTVGAAGVGDLFIASLTRELAVDWSIAYDGAGDQRITSVATNGAGNIFLAGIFEGTLELTAPSMAGIATATAQAGMKEFFLAGLDGNGTPQPVPGEADAIRTFGGFEPTAPVSIRVAAQPFNGAALLTGVFAGSLQLDELYTPAGEVDSFWAAYLGVPPVLRFLQHTDESPGRSRAVAVDGANNSFIAGGYFESYRFQNGEIAGEGGDGYNALIAKVGPDGTPVWVQGDGDMQPQEARDVAVDASGGSYFVGQYQGQLSFGGDPLPVATDSNVFLVRLEP